MKLRYDFHIHSALSPCGDDDMTPNNIVNMAMINGLDIIGLSDHNCCKNVRAVAKLAEKAGMVFVPGIELETAEEIHVLCLFPDVDSVERFEEEKVSPALPPIKNNEAIFGRQLILDDSDNHVATDGRYLLNATTITIDSVAKTVSDYGGIAVPAHIDKQTKSIISVFGMVDDCMGFSVFELSKNASVDYAQNQPSLKDKDYFYLHDSDAHYLTDIADEENAHCLDIGVSGKPTAKQIIDYLRLWGAR